VATGKRAARAWHVLHLGCGACYCTAITAELIGSLGEVTAIELDARFADRSPHSFQTSSAAADSPPEATGSSGLCPDYVRFGWRFEMTQFIVGVRPSRTIVPNVWQTPAKYKGFVA
jgi:hypothetical protein